MRDRHERGCITDLYAGPFILGSVWLWLYWGYNWIYLQFHGAWFKRRVFQECKINYDQFMVNTELYNLFFTPPIASIGIEALWISFQSSPWMRWLLGQSSCKCFLQLLVLLQQPTQSILLSVLLKATNDLVIASEVSTSRIFIAAQQFQEGCSENEVQVNYPSWIQEYISSNWRYAMYDSVISDWVHRYYVDN